MIIIGVGVIVKDREASYGIIRSLGDGALVVACGSVCTESAFILHTHIAPGVKPCAMGHSTRDDSIHIYV